MATTVKVMSGQKCVCYSPEYRADALSLAERIGVAAAPRGLCLYAVYIYPVTSKGGV